MLHLCHFLNHVSFIEEEVIEEEGERDEQEDGAVIGQVGERDEQERDEQVAYTVVSLPCGRAGDVGRPTRRGARSRACSRLVLVLMLQRASVISQPRVVSRAQRLTRSTLWGTLWQAQLFRGGEKQP